MSVAPGQNVAAKRKLNASLAESAIGYVGKLLREEAAKLGITTVSIPPQSASQTCPRCGDRHREQPREPSRDTLPKRQPRWVGNSITSATPRFIRGDHLSTEYERPTAYRFNQSGST